jgi:hypothetical protein
MHPLGDQRSRPRKPLVLHLPPQAGLMRTALCEAALEVRDRRIDFPGATIAALVERESLGPDPAADGLGIEATRRSNLAEGLPLGKAGLDLLITVRPSGVPGTLLLLEPRGTPMRAGAGGRTAVRVWVTVLCLPHGRALRWSELPAPRARGREALQPTRSPGDDAARG